ncbi:MAG: flagellar biosynthesis anti-sigma factor FlgM [Gammaproteobacteria bacterium]|jgi:negative regulator of flagellin synthesis FlgM|nr:flagellar biosynthesis anti-sigma factor FlgM [Gammaproteobacteria bacterium]
MSIDINGISSSRVHVPPDESQVKQQIEQQPANTETGKSSTADTVSISDNAAQLGKLGNTVDTGPVVDMQRVEQVKQAISDGTYEVDATKIADKLMQFESILKS